MHVMAQGCSNISMSLGSWPRSNLFYLIGHWRKRFLHEHPCYTGWHLLTTAKISTSNSLKLVTDIRCKQLVSTGIAQGGHVGFTMSVKVDSTEKKRLTCPNHHKQLWSKPVQWAGSYDKERQARCVHHSWCMRHVRFPYLLIILHIQNMKMTLYAKKY